MITLASQDLEAKQVQRLQALQDNVDKLDGYEA